MTHEEFHALMEADGWSPVQRERWHNIIPLCDADTFRRENSRPDGFIEYKRADDGGLVRLVWKRMFLRHDAKMDSERDVIGAS